MKKILYVRNYPSEVNINSYNLQEIGLGRELVKKGYDCDIVYYSKDKEYEKQNIFSTKENELNIIWMKGLKIFNYVIFKRLLNKSILSQYDLIISTEYSQPMSYIFCKLNIIPVIIYHGPYQDGKKMYLFQKIYDLFAIKVINKNARKVFVKSDLAYEYLKAKKIGSISTLGVGLNTSNFLNVNTDLTNDIKELTNFRFLLYIGQLNERRNIFFLLKVFKKVLEKNKDIKLVLVGNGKEADINKYKNFAKNIGVSNNIIHFEKLDQRSLPFLYLNADVFLFPSNYDIFGMVLLESMYFGVPVISSVNGGAVTLIKNGFNGLVISEFNEENWLNAIEELLNNKDLSKRLSTQSKKTIRKSYTWEKVADNLLSELQL
ncbi:glycosyltransferase family 1 protein [Heyndrickxia coagulans]|uniref:glycosyltransferase family 4 protein n=1 Tax=Heyndrickxia coagulans TaxID=1398 RepID=UPI000E5514A0|nr:glycosyltransferase family 4 protein [Heyndrickxia coagulans]RGR83284.1 glycosyltransferase family 1 protein [Heyndrickxia coagulans]